MGLPLASYGRRVTATAPHTTRAFTATQPRAAAIRRSAAERPPFESLRGQPELFANFRRLLGYSGGAEPRDAPSPPTASQAPAAEGGNFRDLDFTLPGSDRLQNDNILTGRIHDVGHTRRGGGEPADVASGGKRAYEYVRIGRAVSDADAVSQNRPLGQGTGWIDRHYSDGFASLSQLPNIGIDQTGLAHAR